MKKILIGLLSLVFIVSLSHICIIEAATLNGLSIGGDIRIRGLATKNIRDFDDDVITGTQNNKRDSAEFVRHRTRLWIKGEFEGGYTGYVRLTTEPWWGRFDFFYNDSSTPPEVTNHIIIDNSYIVAPDFLGTPLTLKIGRQDMPYGEGFLILDGTPADGSRTIYFDAVKFSGVFGDTSADLFLAKVDEQNLDDWDDEDLYGLYVTNKGIEGHKLEGYLLQRSQNANNNTTNAIGVRATGKIVENLTYGVELCKQMGKVAEGTANEVDRDALGGYVHFTYAMPEIGCKPNIKLGAYYTSGDDGTTNDYEGWDNFYSEWPKYGNILAYTGTGTPGETWTNYMIYELKVAAKPLDKMSASLAYLYAMLSEKNNAADDVLGSWPQAMVAYQFSDAVSGHLLGEYFMPDDFYGPNADEAYFTRFELNIKF